MSKRKHYVEPRVQWKVYLPVTVASETELLLIDPLREKVRYGARNDLIVQLLGKWLEDEKAKIRAARVVTLTEKPQQTT